MIRPEWDQPCAMCGSHRYVKRCYSCQRPLCYHCDPGVWCRTCRDRQREGKPVQPDLWA